MTTNRYVHNRTRVSRAVLFSAVEDEEQKDGKLEEDETVNTFISSLYFVFIPQQPMTGNDDGMCFRGRDDEN